MFKQDGQRGAALFTALIFLIIVTMLSLSAMRASVLELRMAGNQELRSMAFHHAQAVVDATIADSTNMPTLGDVGAMNCMPGDTHASCTTKALDLADNFLASETAYFDNSNANGEVRARVTRLPPLEAPAPRSIGTSASVYSVATFQVSGEYDMSDIGLGHSRIIEGVMVLISK